MSEKEYPQQIRYSYSISLLRAISLSLGVMLVISVLVLLGDLITTDGASVPIIILLSSLIVVGNLLGYVELSMSVPQPGGAYRLVQDCEEGNWLAFLTGWALLLAGITAGGILIQGFARQSAALVETLAGISLPQFPFAVGILLLIAGIKFLPLRKNRNGYLLLLILAAILIFCLVALPEINLDNLEQTNPDWSVSFNLLLISFLGLEITAGLQSEITKRTSNAPRALFITPILAGIITALFAGITSGIFHPGSSAVLGLPLAELANLAAGKWGRVGILFLSVAAIPLALNRIITLLTHQGYAMTNDGFWPEPLKRTNKRANTPVLMIAVFSILIALTLFFPLDYLARLGGLLYLIVLMAVNFTLTRREQITAAPFHLPIHPWIPALVLVFDFLLILTWAEYLPAAGLLLLIGFAIFIGYGRHHSIKAKEGITVFKTVLEEVKTKQSVRVLVPIANPDTAETLLRLAGTLVRQQGGKVIALRVITVPGQVPLSEGSSQAETDHALLDRAVDQATQEEFRVQIMTRVSRSVSEGILDTAREEQVDQILLGWLGDTRSNSLGPVIDPVIKNAPCDVLIVRGDHTQEIKSILVPTAGGPNAPIGAHLAATLSQVYGAAVTGLYVQVGRATPRRMEENRLTIEDTLEGLTFSQPPEKKVVMANNVLDGILKEAESHDLVIVGATEQGSFDQFAFGSIPLRIAAQAPNTAIMVKGYSGTREFLFRRTLTAIFNLFPTLTTEEQLGVREELIEDAQPGSDYFVLIVLSSIIATLGLLLNSPAVVIGAMLVAPLMSPILGFSLGIILGEGRLVRTSLESVFKGVMASIIVAIIIGLLSPLKEMTPEILSRTQPTLLDLLIALASGMAGAYAVSRKDVSAALPGVAIAAALAPPLGVVGLGFANGNMQAAGGALLLFTTNLVTISLGGVIIFTLLGIHPLNLEPETKKRVQRGVTGILFLVFLITIPLVFIMNGIIKQTREQQTIERVLLESPLTEGMSIINIERTQSREQLLISATVRSTEPLDQETVNDLAVALENELDRPLDLDIIFLPTIRSE
jgi:uncharacterized hydrophobic protein (TIGR00271 family)